MEKLGDTVYLRCDEWIIEMRIIRRTDDNSPFSLTDENRFGIYDRRYARYSANCLFVQSIYDMSNKSKKTHIVETSDYNINQPMIFEVGKVITSNIGIPYFKELTRATMYDLHGTDQLKPLHHYMAWRDNCRLLCTCDYVYGQINGHFVSYDEYGNICRECDYDHGQSK